MKNKSCFNLLLIFSIVFCIYIIGLPICSIFFDKNVEHIIGLLIIFSILFLVTLILYILLNLYKIKNEKEGNNNEKINLLKDISLETNNEIKISQEQKEIFKIFCNTLIEL